jgi:hypothetical protein
MERGRINGLSPIAFKPGQLPLLCRRSGVDNLLRRVCLRSRTPVASSFGRPNHTRKARTKARKSIHPRTRCEFSASTGSITHPETIAGSACENASTGNHFPTGYQTSTPSFSQAGRSHAEFGTPLRESEQHKPEQSDRECHAAATAIHSRTASFHGHSKTGWTSHPASATGIDFKSTANGAGSACYRERARRTFESGSPGSAATTENEFSKPSSNAACPSSTRTTSPSAASISVEFSSQRRRAQRTRPFKSARAQRVPWPT